GAAQEQEEKEPESGRIRIHGEVHDQERRHFARLDIEKRIGEVDPDYFEDGNLRALLSRQRFHQGAAAKAVAEVELQVDQMVRDYLREGGLPSFNLQDLRVRSYISQIWKNPNRSENFSPNFLAAIHEIQEARLALQKMQFKEGASFVSSSLRPARGL